MNFKRLFAVAAACLAGVGTASAETQSPRDRLIDLATIQVYHELCRFDLSDAQESAIAAFRDSFVDLGEVSSLEITDLHDELSAAMARQVDEGLCKPGGPGARDYQDKLDHLGSPKGYGSDP